jgi:RNA polymerase sigma-70 factor (ECF subfamily)
LEDTEIISKYFARNEEAIDATAIKYGAYLHTVAYNLLRREEDIEEILNDTYLGAWNSIPPTVPAVLKHFLSRITRNLSMKRLSFLGAEKRAGESTELLSEIEECLPDRRTDPDRILESRTIAETLNTFLGSLAAQEAAVFVSRYYYALSIRELAAKYEMPERKIKYLLKCLRNELRKQLKKEGIIV